jgi:hypothetical protein
MAPSGKLDHEQWLERAASVEVFRKRHGRLPTPGDGPVGAWLSGQRSALHEGFSSITQGRQAVLDELAPGWRSFLPPPTELWPDKVEQLTSFRQAQSRWPSQSADTPAEKSLGVWLSTQRSKAHRGELPEWRRAVLERDAPGWDSTGSRADAWHRTADEVGEFLRIHGRLPSKRATGGEERRLGAWLHNRRQNERVGTGWTSERAAYLDQAAPGWNQSRP